MLDNVESFTFNGTDVEKAIVGDGEDGAYFIVNEVEGRGVPSSQVSSIDITEKDGSYFSGSKVMDRHILITVTIKGTSFEDLRKRIERLGEILHVREPAEIVFQDEPDRYYYGVPENIDELEEESHISKIVITIVCNDPYKYGPEKRYDFPYDIVSVNNEGSVEAEPVFELTALKDTPMVMIQKEEETYHANPGGGPINIRTLERPREYQLLGKPTVGRPRRVPVYRRYDTLLDSKGNNLTGWTTAAMGEVEGNIDGEMEATSEGFKAKSFGVGSEIYGPAIKTSLSEPVQDFRLLSEIDLGIHGAGIGEIYMLDVNGVQVARLSFMSPMVNAFIKYGESVVGNFSDNHYIIDSESKRLFSSRAYLRMEREGNVWRTYLSNSLAPYMFSDEWVDRDRNYMNRVAQIAVRIARFGDDEPAEITVPKVQLDRINERQEDGIEATINEGDRIVFDHRTSDIFINGNPASEHKDFGATYFKLDKGHNRLVVHPANTFETRVKYREKFK